MSVPSSWASLAHLRAALAVLPRAPAALDELEAWLVEAAELPEAAWGFAASIDLARVRLAVELAARSLRGGLVGLLEDSGASEEALARLEAAEEFLGADRAGHWIETHGDDVSRGWSLPGVHPLSRARAVADPSDASERLAAWAADNGITTCSRFGRSLGIGNPHSELRLPLPRGASAAMAAAGDAFAALGVPAPDTAFDALRGVAGPGMELAIRLTQRGLSRLGVIVPRPDTVGVLRLGRAVGVTDLEPLAVLEGALGVDGPASAEVYVAGAGPGVELRYRVEG